MKLQRKICVSSILCWLSCLSMALALYMVFFYAPEATFPGGSAQRIFYFHISSAWTAFLAFFVVMIASLAFLRRPSPRWDILASASAEIGLLFCVMALITGMFWAKPAWNAWWVWDARLTTTLVLCGMYAWYVILHNAAENERDTTYVAAWGVIAFIGVPVVYFSIRVFNTTHPSPVIAAKSGVVMTPEMILTLLLCLGTFFLLFLYLVQHRVAMEQMELELQKIRRSIVHQQLEQGFLIENENFIIEEYNFEEYTRQEGYAQHYE